MNWDDIFSYADETVDWLRAAAEKAEKILAAARRQAGTQRAELTAAELQGMRKTAHALRSNIDDAKVAADSLWGEVRDL